MNNDGKNITKILFYIKKSRCLFTLISIKVATGFVTFALISLRYKFFVVLWSSFSRMTREINLFGFAFEDNVWCLWFSTPFLMYYYEPFSRDVESFLRNYYPHQMLNLYKLWYEYHIIQNKYFSSSQLQRIAFIWQALSHESCCCIFNTWKIFHTNVF